MGSWRTAFGASRNICYNSHPVEFSRDHRFPASVCSQSSKHSMGVGGLRDKGRVAGPRSSGQGMLGKPQLGCPVVFLESPAFPPLLNGPGDWVGGQLCPVGPPSPRWDPSPSPGRTPRAAQACLDLHVHRANVARFVLSDPQLPVFGRVHFSK